MAVGWTKTRYAKRSTAAATSAGKGERAAAEIAAASPVPISDNVLSLLSAEVVLVVLDGDEEGFGYNGESPSPPIEKADPVEAPVSDDVIDRLGSAVRHCSRVGIRLR
jgi:hypothetical protein